MWWWLFFEIIITVGYTTKIDKWQDCSPHTSVKYLSKKKPHTQKKNISIQKWTVMQTWKCNKGSKSHTLPPPPWTHKKVEQEMLSSLHSKPHMCTQNGFEGESQWRCARALALKTPDPKCIRGSKECNLLANAKNFRVIPFIKLQNDT